MEAAALFDRFKNNLSLIDHYLQKGLDVRSMPYDVSLPLEVNLLCDVLRLKGIEVTIDKPGFDAFQEFYRFYQPNEASISDAIHEVLENKRAYLRTPLGTVLVKEQLIRRLEYFNEIAHSMEVIARLQQLGSPLQYDYPFLAS